ncbi:MAG TPA: leucine--tRNA ligase [Candidatus Paceibacterota bacterium]
MPNENRWYDHKAVEKEWQQRWEELGLHKASDERAAKGDKRYCLVEFPYPSGNLHVGHWYAFAVSDIYVRKLRMSGANVMFPIGFDAFGLPAENAAIQHNLNPRDWTEQNMTTMETQLRSMGASFDWSRKISTCDPGYYRWTQWLFLKLLDAGLAYQAETAVNWCPNDKTVLANEQVKDGACERCGTAVEQRKMKQWLLRITKFADALVDDLASLDWPEPIKAAQREWIGRSEGAEIDFQIAGTDEKISVFTTRIDTIFSGAFVTLAPEHSLVEKLAGKISNIDEVRTYAAAAAKKRELERLEGAADKTGVKLEGVVAVNPANGKEIPIFVGDFVLGSYGTGAVFGDAHDERDLAFAEKFGVDLPFSVVPERGYDAAIDYASAPRPERPTLDDGITVNSEQFNGMRSAEARTAIASWLAEKGSARKVTQYRLRDWLVSRQRYWGCPIPVVHCGKCGPVGVPEDQLPVELPAIDSYLPADDGASPLARNAAFVKTTCPTCGGEAERETDTLDTFVDSSWYYYRYCDPANEKEFASRKKMGNWMPVDFYSGGAEHTTMHLLYSRFFAKALASLGLVKDGEPFTRRTNRGLILGPDGDKMSKSKGNVVDPDAEVTRYGADTVRMYLAFLGPYAEVGSYPWDPNGITGVRRFLDRAWRLVSRPEVEPREASLGSTSGKKALHRTIAKVGADIETLKFNTAIAAMMMCLTELEKGGASAEDLKLFVRILAPFAPHLAEELWGSLGGGESVHRQPWPEAAAPLLEDETVAVAVQIGGKVRATVRVARDANESTVRAAAEAAPSTQKHLIGQQVSKVVFVKNRLISFVIGSRERGS